MAFSSNGRFESLSSPVTCPDREKRREIKTGLDS
jgi:hypothetical protein